MICPQTKAKCGHLAFCDITGKCMNYEVGLMDQVDAEVRATIAAVAPPKPTMAEIERLMDALVASSRSDGYVGMEANYHLAARAALRAAIEAYGSGK